MGRDDKPLPLSIGGPGGPVPPRPGLTPIRYPISAGRESSTMIPKTTLQRQGIRTEAMTMMGSVVTSTENALRTKTI